MVKILIVHTRYRHKGGEDTVVSQEIELLKKYYIVDEIYFENKSGIIGALQFLISLYNPFSTRLLKKKIIEFKPDVVHVHNWHFALGPSVFNVLNKMNLPVVHTLHNFRLLCPSAILLHKNKLFLNSLGENFPWTAVWKGVYRKSMIQTFWLAFVIWIHKKNGSFSNIRFFISLTNFAKNLFETSSFKLPENKIIVKPNFFNGNHLQNDLTKLDNFIFIGRLSEEKGIDVLIESFKKLPYVLKVIGDGPLKWKIEQASKRHSNIIYLGKLSNEEVIQNLATSQALVVPSICYEGMPMNIIESLSTGTPVIASNIGAMKSMITPNYNGLHFEVNDSDSLVATIHRFKSLLSSQLELMRNNCLLDYSDKYSVNSQIAYFERIYNAAINSN